MDADWAGGALASAHAGRSLAAHRSQPPANADRPDGLGHPHRQAVVRMACPHGASGACQGGLVRGHGEAALSAVPAAGGRSTRSQAHGRTERPDAAPRAESAISAVGWSWRVPATPRAYGTTRGRAGAQGRSSRYQPDMSAVWHHLDERAIRGAAGRAVCVVSARLSL